MKHYVIQGIFYKYKIKVLDKYLFLEEGKKAESIAYEKIDSVSLVDKKDIRRIFKTFFSPVNR